MSLNEQQKKAAANRHGHAIVLAGPGTGKTLTLVARHAFLRSTGSDPDDVMVVTFTKEAAEELKQKLSKFVSRNAWIGTFPRDMPAHSPEVQRTGRASAELQGARPRSPEDPSCKPRHRLGRGRRRPDGHHRPLEGLPDLTGRGRRRGRPAEQRSAAQRRRALHGLPGRDAQEGGPGLRRPRGPSDGARLFRPWRPGVGRGAYPALPRRRVPGRQQGAGRVPPGACGNGNDGLGGRRRRPVPLRMAGRERKVHGEVLGVLRRRAVLRPHPELPMRSGDRRGRQLGYRQQQAAGVEEARGDEAAPPERFHSCKSLQERAGRGRRGCVRHRTDEGCRRASQGRRDPFPDLVRHSGDPAGAPEQGHTLQAFRRDRLLGASRGQGGRGHDIRHRAREPQGRLQVQGRHGSGRDHERLAAFGNRRGRSAPRRRPAASGIERREGPQPGRTRATPQPKSHARSAPRPSFQPISRKWRRRPRPPKRRGWPYRRSTPRRDWSGSTCSCAAARPP